MNSLFYGRGLGQVNSDKLNRDARAANAKDLWVFPLETLALVRRSDVINRKMFGDIL